ncbi:LysR family transcriptional regulator [Agromyces sp. NPDC049794]|uniref:LysR family transcriptional regulator n=1 Tax=unclassified Agromyces TaxID=2639701 RepID=UPI0033F47B76
MSLTLRQVEVFAAVIDHGGFGAAADHLRMSQSAVSHTLAALERATGAPLVRRAPDITTTALGEAVLPYARSVLAAARALGVAIDSQTGKDATGLVRVAAAPTVAHRLIPDLFALWRAEIPGVDVRLFEGSDTELEDWLATGTVDAAVLIDPDPFPAGGLLLASDEFRAVLRMDHPLATSDAIELDDLLADPLLVSSSGCEPQIKQLHAMTGVRYDPAQRVHEVSTLLAMVEAHLGVAIMPSLAAAMLPTTLTMVELQPRLGRRLVFTGPTNRPWHPHVTRMRDIAGSSPRGRQTSRAD